MRRRQWLAIVLSIVMAVTFIPTIAFAAEEGEAAVEAQPEAEATLEAEPEAEAPAETDVPDVVKAAEDEDDDYYEDYVFTLNVDELTDADFLDSEDGYYKGYTYIWSTGDYEIESYSWEGDGALCEINEDYGELELIARSAGTSILNVKGEDGSVIRVPVTISQKAINEIRYEEFFEEHFDTQYSFEPGYEDETYDFKGYLYLENYNDYVDYEWQQITIDELINDCDVIATFNGTTYNVDISATPDEDGDYVYMIPGIPYDQMKVGDAITITFIAGDYSAEKQIVKRIYIEPKLTMTRTFVWTGKQIRPTVKLTWEGITLQEGTDYELDYYEDEDGDVAENYVEIEPCGIYDFWVDWDDRVYTIIPKGTSFNKKYKRVKKGFTVTWKKQSARMQYGDPIRGYHIQIALNSKFTKGKKNYYVKGYSKTSKKITKLKKKKKYYVRIRTYYPNGDTGFIYSKWSSTKTVKTK